MSDTTIKRIGLSRKKKRLIFYVAFMSIPSLHFVVFYLGINFNSFLLAFKTYDPITLQTSFAGTVNFQNVLYDLTHTVYLRDALKNSLFIYGISIPVMFLTLFISYYLYKKAAFSGVIRVMLFLPHIISNIVLVVMYKYFVERALPTIWESITGRQIEGLVANPKTTFFAVWFFTFWFGFGLQVLLYSTTMSRISESIVEAAKIDGITFGKEFILITIPMIWPTIVTFLTIGIANIFTSQLNLYHFFGKEADYSLYTFGYFIYVSIVTAKLPQYPYLSALGLVLTSVALPLTLIIKRCLEKFGPSTS